MHLAFLKAEFAEIAETTPDDARLLTTPDLEDLGQNERRRQLLCRRRGPLLVYIPQSTEWFKVRYLERQHLHQLRAINFRSWNSPGVDENELLKVARRKTIRLQTAPSEWAAPP